MPGTPANRLCDSQGYDMPLCHRLVNRPQRQPAVPSFAEDAVGEADEDDHAAEAVGSGSDNWVRPLFFRCLVGAA